jgi:hypothetical protein
MARLKSTIRNPLHYARVIAIVKEARAREKFANTMWLETEEKNGPLWAENKRLRDLAASYERIIRQLTDEKTEALARLEQIDSAIKAIV